MGQATSTSWKAGPSGNPKGRPRREVEREYLGVVMRLCDVTTWARVIEKTIVDAVAGDYRAREFLARYILGDPKNLEADDNGQDELVSVFRELTQSMQRKNTLADEMLGLVPDEIPEDANHE